MFKMRMFLEKVLERIIRKKKSQATQVVQQQDKIKTGYLNLE